MDHPTLAELENLFAEQRIPRHRLYPWWYRLYRRLGLRVDPPIFFTLGQHLLCEGVPIAVICALGTVYNLCCMTTPVRALLPTYSLTLLIPLANWWSYRRLRRRLGV